MITVVNELAVIILQSVDTVKKIFAGSAFEKNIHAMFLNVKNVVKISVLVIIDADIVNVGPVVSKVDSYVHPVLRIAVMTFAIIAKANVLNVYQSAVIIVKKNLLEANIVVLEHVVIVM